MIILFVLLAFFSLLTIVLLFLYIRQTENQRLDRMALQNLVSEQEKAYYINEYKKIIVAQFIYEAMAEDKTRMEITRELIRAGRNIPVVQYFPPNPGVPAQEIVKPKQEEGQ